MNGKTLKLKKKMTSIELILNPVNLKHSLKQIYKYKIESVTVMTKNNTVNLN